MIFLSAHHDSRRMSRTDSPGGVLFWVLRDRVDDVDVAFDVKVEAPAQRNPRLVRILVRFRVKGRVSRVLAEQNGLFFERLLDRRWRPPIVLFGTFREDNAHALPPAPPLASRRLVKCRRQLGDRSEWPDVIPPRVVAAAL